MKLTIWHGRATPLVAVGKHQVKALDFAFKYQGWHTFKTTCRSTVRAIQGLLRRGHIEVEGDQFRVKLS
jgi:hypothetical protein